MTELKHLQRVLLDMAKYIDSFCKENGIEYYLDGGSALGAIRHKGFIPWDDDFDIIMDDYNYRKFIKVCREKLDKSYYLQEGLVDWPSNFSKIRLKNTRFIESINPISDEKKQGIFIDIFKMDNVPSGKIRQFKQFVIAKLLLAYQLSQYGYKSDSFKKKIFILCASLLKNNTIRSYLMNQVTKYNDKETEYLGSFFDKTNFHNSIISKKIWGRPTYVPFEDTFLPVQEHWDEYLTIIFGDYMTPPPVCKQVPEHMNNIDFGNY